MIHIRRVGLIRVSDLTFQSAVIIISFDSERHHKARTWNSSKRPQGSILIFEEQSLERLTRRLYGHKHQCISLLKDILTGILLQASSQV
jgi:hypothetical protein